MSAIQALLDALVDWLVRASWQGAILAVLVLMVTWMLRRWLAPSARYALFGLVAARLIMPMVPHSPVSAFNFIKSPGKSPQVRIDTDPAPIGQWVVSKEPFSRSVAQISVIAAAPTAPVFTWRLILTMVWLVGALFVTGRVVRANLKLSRRLRRASLIDDPHILHLLASCKSKMGVGRALPILETDAIHSPALMGLFRPRLLLPLNLRERLTDAEMRFVFLHELAHLKRHDIAVDWCLAIVQTMHWFNPLIALAFARARAERELARDAMVLAATAQGEQTSYGRTILKLVESFAGLGPRPGTIGILEGNSGKIQLKRRITMIADFKCPKRGGTILAALIAAILAMALLTDCKATADSAPAAQGGDAARSDPKGADAAGPAPRAPAETAAAAKLTARDAAAQALLDHVLPEVKLNAVALGDAVEFLRDVSGGNISVNWKALEAAGVEQKAPVSTRMRNVKLSTALAAILKDAGGDAVKLGFEIEDGVIVITTDEEISKNTTVEVYDVNDLLMVKDEKARDEQANQLIKLSEEVIDPQSWTANGGSTGTIKHLNGQLIITQTRGNHKQVVQLLDKLREARAIQVVVRSHLIKVQMKMLKDIGIDIEKDGDNLKVDKRIKQPAKPVKSFQGTFLDDNHVDLLLRAVQASPDSTTLSSPRITLFNGQQGSIAIGEEIPYIAGWSAPKDGKREPQISHVKTGFLFNLQATVSADRKYVTMNMQPRIARLRKMEEVPWPQAPAGEKLNIQKPDLAVQEVDEMVSVPDGGTLLTVMAENQEKGNDPKGTVNILLVRPSIIIQREVEEIKFPLENKPGEN